MADFAIWATACETAFWSTGTFVRCYEANRRASMEDVVDADPVAACVREIMAERNSWTGTAADLLRVGAGRSSDGRGNSITGWPRSPRELAGRLRRAQTSLRALGIDIAFAREGRAGNRVIRIRVMHETVSTVSNVRHNGCQWGSEQPPPAPTGAGPVAAADDADGTDANAGFPMSTSIDKSKLAIGAPRRYRNREHIRFIAQQPCLLCARKPSDPHHLRFMQPRALGRKASDKFTVPLCRIHHRAVHRAGDERAWWTLAGIDPIKIARKLWRQTLGTGGRPQVG